ncbi:MAG: heterodisulfide reductase subunit F [bacterium]|nr:heterodisulfide reductase subunit F [bacterium]
MYPIPTTLEKVIVETAAADLKSFYLKFENGNRWDYLPGQFAELSLYGEGESPIGIASSPTEGDHLMFTVFETGRVSRALHRLSPGQAVGIRGPLGNAWPLEELKGKNVVVIGGGFAFTTQRSLVQYILDNRNDYGDLTVIYGARSPGALLYKPELEEWKKSDAMTLHLTVDAAGEEAWDGREGFVPTVVGEEKPSSENAVALICGPPIMIKFTLPVMDELGWKPEQIYTSLEMRMKCGVGMCGRCNIGTEYVCIDGPVFSFAQLSGLPEEY